MTKRFEKAKFGTVIQDNSKQDTLWTATECIDRMNELAEENEVCKEAYNEIKSDAIHLKKENEQLKEALFFYISVAITETSSHINEDLEKECNQLLKCSYKEALEKYDTSKYE